jgi:pantetheine-phosphate adenylyltransferase
MAAEPRLAIYPGTFDPLTNGHVDLIERTARMFDRVIVAILLNTEKRPFFTVAERVAMIREVCHGQAAVEVETFEGLLVDYARRRRATAIVRGLRGVADFEYERQMALMNRHLSPDIETIFMMPTAQWGHLSSTLVKEVSALGGSVTGLVPPAVADRLTRKRDAGRKLDV